MPSHVLTFNPSVSLTRALLRAMAVLFALDVAVNAATLEDVAKRTGLAVCDSTESRCVLTNGAGKIVFFPGSRRFEFNRRSIWLNSPVIADFKSGLTFEYPDMAKLICPLFAEPVVANTNLCIQLDAGHGGEDGGCISTHNRMREKDLVLDIVLRIGEILEDRGFSVVYSRTNDTFVTLAGRSAIASSRKADAFVSIHANFAGSHTARGTETFTLPFANAESTSSENSVGTAARIGNANDLRNTMLGYFIHRRLPGRVGEADRGLRHARFQVLRDAPCPATLVEVGFLSNVNDSRDLASNWYRDKLAMAVADGVTEFASHIPAKSVTAPSATAKSDAPVPATNVTGKVAAKAIAKATASKSAAVTNRTAGAVVPSETNAVPQVTNAAPKAAGPATNATDAASVSATNAAVAVVSSVTNGVEAVATNATKATQVVTGAVDAATGKEKADAVVVP